MIKNKRTKIALLVIFLIIETALFFAVQITSGEENDIYMMSVVILACLFMLTSFEKTKQYLFMQIGLLCTVLADVFLVIMDPEIEIPAMIFFSVTQICYFLRLYFDEENEKRRKAHLILRLSISVLSLIVPFIILGSQTDFLSIISVFYYANLILNVIMAFTNYKKCLIFAIGLTLFLCCDTLVGLNAMLSMYLNSDISREMYKLLFENGNLPWIFYTPSQALIAISIIKLENTNN